MNVPVYAVKENIVQFPHVKPLAAFRAAFEIFALGLGQLLVLRIRHKGTVAPGQRGRNGDVYLSARIVRVREIVKLSDVSVRL